MNEKEKVLGQITARDEKEIERLEYARDQVRDLKKELKEYQSIPSYIFTDYDRHMIKINENKQKQFVKEFKWGLERREKMQKKQNDLL